jgi:hypothetical protein
MSANDAAAVLGAEIGKNLKVLQGVFTELEGGLQEDIVKLGRTGRSATMIAGILESYYTCLETIFLRISQFFENELRKDRWHGDLLDRMILEIDDVRARRVHPAVVRELRSFIGLLEKARRA